ncbi:MAG TPA: hypothetical protein VMZ28_25660 [Kofleriaceae bacterium]|nr:hypothetical protein [Kofleriaceae bacterium]
MAWTASGRWRRRGAGGVGALAASCHGVGHWAASGRWRRRGAGGVGPWRRALGGVGVPAYPVPVVAEPCKHYVVAVRRHERVHYLIWFGSDQDGVLTTSGGASLLGFATDAEARAHAAAGALVVSPDESAYFDLDELDAWTSAPNPYRLRADDILNAWNLLGDVAHSVRNQVAEAKLLDRRDNALYSRLMSCCAIPALGLPVADRPTPDDCAAIAAVLRHGLACFDAAITPPPAPAPAPR